MKVFLKLLFIMQLIFGIWLGCALVCFANSSSEVSLQSSSSTLVLNKDLKSIKTCKDSSGHQFVSKKSVPLYQIHFGNDYESDKIITTYEAQECKIIRLDNTFAEIEYHHPDDEIQIM